MKGDFARITFDPTHHFRRVLRQQGRVDVEADFNEQSAVILHYLEQMMIDIIGPYAAPLPGPTFDGFKITMGDDFTFLIDPGHYWVDGILCENDAEQPVPYHEQPDFPADLLKAGTYLVYLDAWDRHVSADENPSLREVALGGPDTASRARLVWQVRVESLEEGLGDLTPSEIHDDWLTDWVLRWQPANRGQLSAWAEAGPTVSEPCVTPPDSQYRGPENQLYRVEIHEGGSGGTATFKWSRDNGSNVYPIRSAGGDAIRLGRLSVDPRFTLKPDDWIEVLDDDITLSGQNGLLARVKEVDYDEAEITVTLQSGSRPIPGYATTTTTHPIVRRWDQVGNTGTMTVAEGAPIELEDGVMVEFATAKTTGGEATYRTGDYWTIPARVITGDVEWPRNAAGGPEPRKPHGVQHHYAPLALLVYSANGAVSTNTELRLRILVGVQDA